MSENPPIWGATYLPARTYNSYLHWRHYDPEVTRRDLGFAAKVRLNALRVFVSFDAWLDDADKLQADVDHLLATAELKGLRIVPVLFDHHGVAPAANTLHNRDPLTATRTRSPHPDTLAGSAEDCTPCRDYVTWFVGRYGSDGRVAAVDLGNAPAATEELRFARDMFRAARAAGGSVPLTIGTASLVVTRFLLDLGPDVLQFQCNFPRSQAALEAAIQDALDTQELLGRPVWLAEWQRVRPSAAVAHTPLPADEATPAYATMADAVRSSGLAGAFFNGLMVNPAMDLSERTAGVLSGLFHDDGAVWSLQDARAISNDLRLFTVERREWPDFAKPARQAYLDPQ